MSTDSSVCRMDKRMHACNWLYSMPRRRPSIGGSGGGLMSVVIGKKACLERKIDRFHRTQEASRRKLGRSPTGQPSE